MTTKLVAPCKICPHKDLPRDSETCSKCKDTDHYADYLCDHETFFKTHPNFKYSFETINELKEIYDELDLKFCVKCEKDKLKRLFYNNKSTGDGLSVYCKKCQNELTEESRQKKYKKKIYKKKEIKLKKSGEVETESKPAISIPGADDLIIDISRFPDLKEQLEEISEKEIRGTVEAQALWFLIEAVKKYNEKEKS